jgi:rare lipoprotein A (peptidoglycan hydrolase)
MPHIFRRFSRVLLPLAVAVFFVASPAVRALEAATFSNPKVASVHSIVRTSVNARQAKIPNLTAFEKARVTAAEAALSKAFKGVDAAFILSDAEKAASIRQLSRSYSNLSKLLSALALSRKGVAAASFETASPGVATQDLGTAADITYYADSFDGRGTASGERFSQNVHSAARCSVSFGKLLQVSFAGKSLIVKANDRPNCSKYPNVVDLSSSAFKVLAPLSKGRLAGSVAEL